MARKRSICLFLFFQITFLNYAMAQIFPQQVINSALQKRSDSLSRFPQPNTSTIQGDIHSGVKQLLSRTAELLHPVLNRTDFTSASSAIDTVFVGAVPNDTLVITGTWFNNGPILVFNDGVLIFDTANATILGDIFVFQDGKMFANNSTLAFPQLYFYQRSWILANNGYVEVNNCTLDVTGLSHNLLAVHHSQIVMNNIQNLGFTTASAYGQASIAIDSTNQAGEFILNDSASYSFTNANTVLLWHTVPNNAVVDITFPSAGIVPSYSFNSGTAGVSGINYDVQLGSCSDVMWALMPVNGSDVTVNGSTIRAIGLWFERGDTVNVSGLVNNSSYSSFLAPLNDRVLQLNNCSVQTWSLYVFDSSSIAITGCIVGEVGSMGRSYVVAQGVFCDGSGGYYWTNDTSFSIAISSTVFTSIRSQGSGIFVFGYGSVNGSAAAIGNSVLIVTQSSLPQDPIPYDNGVAWLVNINPIPVSYVNSTVAINGSAWIDQGPSGAMMDFGSYDLYYSTSLNPGTWIPISSGSTTEVRNAFLGQWITTGLAAGAYNLRLNTFNNFGDSIDAVKQVTLLPSVVGLNEIENENVVIVQPNPATDQVQISFNLLTDDQIYFSLFDIMGKQLMSRNYFLNSGKKI
ncbi:MAG: hypothetical protein IPP71_05475 [Bacteroidetes bacterium]|nr:hypothetical protein [Bacteroidota bacterium]